MSGPYDVPDDPDDVTLWAGRLRPWPARPDPAVDDGDEIDEDTAVSLRSARAEDTVRVVREEPSDATVRIVRDEPSDETARARGGEGAAAATPDESFDDTIRGSREATPRDDPPPALEETTAVGRRRRGAATSPEPEPPSDAPTGDTAAGTRRSRSRERVTTDALPSADPVPRPRDARIPSGGAHELYRPRADEAIRVARSAPPARSDDAPDAAEVRPRSVRRGRTRGFLLLAAIVVVASAAAVALFLLMG
ncbi:hypothetical protein [Microbacterium sp. S16(2024)]